MEPSIATPKTSSANAVNESNRDTPVGTGFRPTKTELIHLLKQRATGAKRPDDRIPEGDLYDDDSHPTNLAQKYPKLDNRDVWYMYTPRRKLYRKGSKPNRTAGNGYWKATSIKDVKDKGVKIGKRRSLCFYEGDESNSKRQKTNWIMHEYILSDDKMDEVVLCEISETGWKKKTEVQPPEVPNEQSREVLPQSGNTESNSNNVHANSSEIGNVLCDEPSQVDQDANCYGSGILLHSRGGPITMEDPMPSSLNQNEELLGDTCALGRRSNFDIPGSSNNDGIEGLPGDGQASTIENETIFTDSGIEELLKDEETNRLLQSLFNTPTSNKNVFVENMSSPQTENMFEENILEKNMFSPQIENMFQAAYMSPTSNWNHSPFSSDNQYQEGASASSNSVINSGANQQSVERPRETPGDVGEGSENIHPNLLFNPSGSN